MNSEIPGVIVWLASAAAWFTGVGSSIANDQMGLLLIDVFIPPVGVIHGALVWFGVA